MNADSTNLADASSPVILSRALTQRSEVTAQSKDSYARNGSQDEPTVMTTISGACLVGPGIAFFALAPYISMWEREIMDRFPEREFQDGVELAREPWTGDLKVSCVSVLVS
jgi:hypothetical protein